MASAVAKKVLENTLFLIAGRLFSRAMQFILFIYAARQLGVAVFGHFSFAYATVNLFAITMDLGLASYLVQQLSRQSRIPTALFRKAVIVKAMLIPLGLAAVLAVGYFMSKEANAIWPLVILGLAAALDSVTALFNAAFKARQEMKYPAYIIALGNGTMAVVGLVLLFFYPRLTLLCVVFAFGAVLRCIISAIFFLRIIRFDPTIEYDHSAGKLLFNAFPFALVTIFVTIYYYIDTLILTRLCGSEVVGQYNAAYRLLEAPLFIIQAVTTALFPAASDFYMRDRRQLHMLTAQVVEKATAFGVSIAIVTVMVADDLVRLLYGATYSNAGRLLAVLIISVAIIMPSTVCGSTLRATDRQNISAIVTGLGALLNIGLNLALIPYYEALGAAWATVATEGFVLVIYAVLVWRWVGPLVSAAFLLRLLLISLLWVAAMMATRMLGVVAQIIAAVVLFFPFLIAGGIFKTKELKNVLQRKAPS